MNKNLVGVFVAFSVCTGVAAQSLDADKNRKQQGDSLDVKQLDEVVVSDSRFELKRENSGKTVIKISSEELERNQGRNVTELINTKSGIEITGSRGREGSIFGVFARGGRGRQVLILIDGIRVSDPSSSSSEYDMRLLSTANIESIEIIKGAASTLYGTNAATAVINITTKKASQKSVSSNFLSSIGTNQTVDDQNYNLSRSSNSAQISGTFGRFSYRGNFSNRYAEGLSDLITPENEKDGFSHFSTDLSLGYHISDRMDIRVYGNQTKTRTDFDESFGFLDAPYRFLSDQERVGISAHYSYGKGALHLNGAHSTFDSENISAFPNVFKGSNTVTDLYHKYNFNDALYTIMGINYSTDVTEYERKEKFEIIDPYLNMVFVSKFGLNLNIGGRLNTHSEYGNNLVYNLNPSFTFKLNEGYLKVLGSYATSYITPSLTQLFGNFGANPNLEPEDNRTIEGGLEFKKNKLRLSGIYFNRKEENFVFYDLAENRYQNSESTIDAQGVEVEFSLNLSEALDFTTNYTFTERKGDNAIRIPKHKINAELGYAFSSGTYASLQYNQTGRRSDTDFSRFPSVDVPLEAFSLVHLYLSHECIKDKLKFFLNVSNIFNDEYTEVIGFTTKGRNFMVGFNLNL
ncbi:MAG: TonB-dependent receptor [Pricia sp.]|nr:TonB-dependent receptor [Pricia sp.]